MAKAKKYKARESAEASLKRVRDYALEEPGFTVTFLVWDLKQRGQEISGSAVKTAVDKLLADGTIKVVEDGGTMGRVYAAAPARNVRLISPLPNTHFPELDEARMADLAPERGKVVAHTRRHGSTGKPGKDRKLQEEGWKIKRTRQGT